MKWNVSSYKCPEKGDIIQQHIDS